MTGAAARAAAARCLASPPAECRGLRDPRGPSVSSFLPCSCRGWPAVSCRSWLWDKVNLFPWNCSVTGVSGWATRLGGPAREASWAILTTSPPAEMRRKRERELLRKACGCYTDDRLPHRTTVGRQLVSVTKHVD